MYIYSFDPTGVLAANRIINELVTPSSVNSSNAYLIIPAATPFYKKGLSVVGPTGLTLVEGVDYYLTHHWDPVFEHTGLEAFGGIALIGSATAADVVIGYQTLGGEYAANRANAIASGIVALASVLDVDWTTAPTTFPSTPHNEMLSGLTGMTDVIAALDRMVLVLGQPASKIKLDDVQDLETEFIAPVIATLTNIALAITNNNSSGTLLNTLTADVQAMTTANATRDNRLDNLEAALQQL